jgi:hypothetical protein
MDSTEPCIRRAPTKRRYLAAGAVLVLAVGAGACRPGPGGGGGGGGSGTGPGGGAYEVDSGLPRHTIFHPANLASVTRPMPIVVWGNGGCIANSLLQKDFLSYTAGKGVFVIASGLPNGTGSTTAAMMTQAIDWAVKENTRAGSKYAGKIDTTKVSAQGGSCGGLEAVVTAADPRVGSTILWSSGIFATGGLGGATKAALTKLHSPTAWLDGGTSDIAHAQAVSDYAQVPNTVPAVLGSYGNVGHGGQLTAGTAAEISQVNKDWLDATLYGDATARAKFVGPDCGLCRGTKWVMQSKNW